MRTYEELEDMVRLLTADNAILELEAKDSREREKLAEARATRATHAEADLAALRATVERLCGALAEIGIAIFEQADDTLWLSDVETGIDRIFDLLGLSGDGDSDEQLERLRRAAAERTRAIAEAGEARDDA